MATVLGGCSERESHTPAPAAAPAADIGAPGFATSGLQKMSSEVATPSGHAKYDAYFAGQQLRAIREYRESPAGLQVRGEYVFEGARLLQYTGIAAAASEEVRVRLALDLQGQLQSADHLTRPGEEVPLALIDAIRTRAQLLRSVALAHRASSAHRTDR